MDFNRALKYSFLLLKYRARTREEIAARLRRRGVVAAVIEKVLSYLQENNYVNDKDFTRSFIASSLAKGWGPRKIEFKLRQLGIPPQDITPDLFGDEAARRRRISELIDKRINYYKQGNKYQKTLKYLVACGFSCSDVIVQMQDKGIAGF